MRSKSLWVILFLLTLPTIYGYSQTPFVPKHEVSLYFSTSFNTFLYGPTGRYSVERNGYNLLWMSPFGIEYTYHFDNNWGISTGLGFTYIDLTLYSKGNSYSEITPGIYPDNTNEPVRVGVQYTFSGEQHWVKAAYFTVPLLAQYIFPLDTGHKWHFYAQAGLRLGVNFPALGFIYDVASYDGHDEVLAKPLGIHGENSTPVIEPMGTSQVVGHSGSNLYNMLSGRHAIRRCNLFGCVEAGIRFPIYRAFGIYVGGFADLGVLRATKRSNDFFQYKEEIHPYGTGHELISSIFTANLDGFDYTVDGDDFIITQSQKPMLRGLLPFSAGLKVKFAF